VLAARRISDSVYSSKVADRRGAVRGISAVMGLPLIGVDVVDVEIV
jgi:hypothetical protein